MTLAEKKGKILIISCIGAQRLDDNMVPTQYSGYTPPPPSSISSPTLLPDPFGHLMNVDLSSMISVERALYSNPNRLNEKVIRSSL